MTFILKGTIIDIEILKQRKRVIGGSVVKKLTSLLLVITMVLSLFCMSSFAGTSDLTLKVDGLKKDMQYEENVQVINDVTYLPLREIVDLFDATIDWNSKDKSMIIKIKNDVVEAKIDSDTIKMNSTTCSLGEKVILNNSRTMVPISFMELLGIKVSLNDKAVDVSSSIKEYEQLDITVDYLGGPSAISMIKMLKEKPYLGKNTNVTYEMLKQVPLIQANMLNKKADFIVAPTNMGAMVYNKTKGEYLLADVYSWGVLYLSSTEEIKSWEDLKGKEIYLIGKTGTPGIVTNNLLKLNGLEPEKDVKLIYLSSPQELASYMIAGKAKTAILPEPVQTQVLMKNKNVKVAMNIQEEWAKKYDSKLGFPQSSIFVKKELVDSRPDVVRAFLREHKASINWVNANKADAGLTGKELGIMPSEKIIEKSIPRCNLNYVDAKDAKKATEDFLKTILSFNPKAIGDKLPDEGFYYENK